MVSSGSGGGQKRRIKYTDEAHRKNAEKQALWRKRHPDKYEVFKERKNLKVQLAKGSRELSGWFVWEIVNESGEIIDVVMRFHNQPIPEGAQHGQFAPPFPLSYWVARTMRDSRLEQLQKWREQS
jgi:hypothetical protein